MVPLSHFVYDFLREMFPCYVLLTLALEILVKMGIENVCLPGCDVIERKLLIGPL